VTRLALLAAGLLLGLGAGWLVWGPSGTEPEVNGTGTLARLPAGPVEVQAETVRLGAGFRSRHVHGGPTFNLVRAGEVEIVEGDGRRRYRRGELFFEPAGRPHTIVVLEDARLDVLRLLPPGAPATEEVG